MMNQTTVQRRLTRAFVSRAPLSVRFRSVMLQETADGGSRRVRGSLRRAQVITLVEPSSSAYGPTATGVEGTTRDVDYMLVADIDVEIHELDEFDVDGAQYQIRKIMPSNGYEVRAYVVRTS